MFPSASPPAPRRAGRARRWMGVLGAALLALAILYAARVPILVGIAGALSVDDEPRPADLIFVLGGDVITRPRLAARLYHQGLAPRIVLARVQDPPPELHGILPNETDAAVRMLRRLGVPDSALVVLRSPGGVTSTTEEGIQLRRYLQRYPARRVLVVTTRYHTRRARWNLRRALDDLPVQLLMVGVEAHGFTERDWWRSEEGLIRYFEEYVKFMHNWLYRW